MIVRLGLLLLMVASLPRIATADDWQRLDYRIHTETDSLSDEKTVMARASAWQRGTDSIDVEASCEGTLGVSFEFVYFRRNDPLDIFSDDKDWYATRIRFDSSPVVNGRAMVSHSNGISLIFIDKARMQAALKKGTSENGKGSLGMALAEGITRWATQTAIENAAAGTILGFARAQRIGVEIPLPGGGHFVVDLTPGNPVLRRFMADCIR